MKRIKRIRWLLLGITAAAVTLSAAWPRPKLVWFTTPAIRLGDELFRVKLLVPRDWHAVLMIPPEPGRPRTMRITLAAPDPITKAVRQVLHGLPEHDAGIWIDLSRIEPDSSIHPEIDTSLEPGGIHLGMRVFAKRPLSIVRYQRTNRMEFDSTYKAILNSARLDRVRE